MGVERLNGTMDIGPPIEGTPFNKGERSNSINSVCIILWDTPQFYFLCMARSKQSKHEILERLTTSLDKALSIIFVSVKGLSVHEMEEFRGTLRAEASECVVAKKTLMTKAFAEAGSSIDFKTLDGEVAAVFGYADQVAPARLVNTFGKQHEHLKILAGILKDDAKGTIALTVSTITALATLPSRAELRARVVGSLAAPLRNCVGMLSAPARAFVQVLNAYAQTK